MESSRHVFYWNLLWHFKSTGYVILKKVNKIIPPAWCLTDLGHWNLHVSAVNQTVRSASQSMSAVHLSLEKVKWLWIINVFHSVQMCWRWEVKSSWSMSLNALRVWSALSLAISNTNVISVNALYWEQSCKLYCLFMLKTLD